VSSSTTPAFRQRSAGRAILTALFYERIIAVDLLAPIALTQAVLPRMVTRNKAGS